MKNVEYIHYGITKDEYDPELVRLISDHVPISKPNRGLWASPCDNDNYYTWKNWCEAEMGYIKDDSHSFKFKISDKANIITIDSPEALREYVVRGDLVVDDVLGMHILRELTFPEDVYDKYDGIELIHGSYYGYFHSMFTHIERLTAVALSKTDIVDDSDGLLEFCSKTAGIFNSWDCDSVCIWNPDVIEIIDERCDEKWKRRILKLLRRLVKRLKELL